MAAQDDLKELTFFDLVKFLKPHWKIAVFAALSGLVLSAIYLSLFSIKYIAIAQIEIGRLPDFSNSRGALVEDPSELINKLNSTNIFFETAALSCNFINDEKNLRPRKNVSMSASKAYGIVDLKVGGLTDSAARECAESIADSIIQYQSNKIEPIVKALKAKKIEKLSMVNRYLKVNMDLFAKSFNTSEAVSVRFLGLLQENRNLEDEKIRLETDLMSSSYLAGADFPKIRAITVHGAPYATSFLFIGFSLGGIIGFIIALIFANRRSR
jgi:hypothetical protein